MKENANIYSIAVSAIDIFNNAGGVTGVLKLAEIADKGNVEIGKNYKFVKAELAKLADIAKYNSEVCAGKRKLAEEEYSRLAKQTEELYSEYDETDKQLNDCEAKIVGLQIQINETNRQIAQKTTGLKKCEEEIVGVNKSIADTKKDFWWAWLATPLLIYKLAELKAKKDQGEKTIAEVSEEIAKLESIIKDYKNSISLADKLAGVARESSTDLGRKLSLISQKTSESIVKISECSYIWRLWEGLETILSKAVSSISNSGSKDGIENSFLLLCELKSRLDNAEIEQNLVRSSVVSGLVYRGNALYPGQKLKRGEYIASLNKRFVAVLTKEGNFAVYNSDLMLRLVSENVQELTFDTDGLVRFGNRDSKRSGATVLIMQDDGNLVTYNSTYAPLWATDTWQYGSLISKQFFVNQPFYKGTYKIESCNSLCFDIRDRSFANNAPLQLYLNSNVDNQKFMIEQTESGAYKIIPSHSGKCLDVLGNSVEDGAKLMQCDFHNGMNQLFWILPCKEVGCVKIVAAHSGKPLDVVAGDFKNFTPIQQYYENGTAAQIFKLVMC